MKKRIVSILLATLLLISLAACSKPKDSTSNDPVSPTATPGGTEVTDEPASNYPSYLNLESTHPIIKEGEGEDITLSVAIVRYANTGEWDDLWLSKYFENYYNLNLDVEQLLLDATLRERLNLMFVSGDLPDLLLNLELGANDIMKYGQMESQLLKLDEYLSDELTPDINYMLEKKPVAKALATTPDGHIYSLPNLLDINNEGQLPDIFINQKWLDACGLSNPKTLDEFIEMARTFKEMDPGGVGSENVIPIGGSNNAFNLSWYFLNSFGYVGGGGFGLEPAIRNGQAEIPAGNAEIFKEYLSTMKTLFDEGLVSSDYFTADDAKVKSQLSAGQIGVFGSPVYSIIDTWKDWTAAYPLSSQWNNTPVFPTPPAATIGGFAVAADTEYPELCLRFGNAYFSEDSSILWSGPGEGTEEAMGYFGSEWDPDTKTAVYNKFPEGVADLWTYVVGHLTGVMPKFGALGEKEVVDYYYVHHLGGEASSAEKTFDINSPEGQYRATVTENQMQYRSETFPYVYYIDEETITKLSDLRAVLEPYVMEQVALFISGGRSLDEFDSYISELNSIGFDEYQQIYKDIWAIYKSAK